MRKRGFTLTELLVAMLIIGVIAAITAPMISGLMPNKEKMIVLKYHKVLSDICQELINDKSLYWEEENNSGRPCHGFGCTQQPMYAPYNGDSKYKDNLKLTSLIFDKLEGTQKDSNHFLTTDGMYLITVPSGPSTGGDFDATSTLFFIQFRDFEKQTLVSYNSDNKKYNCFSFMIDTYGKLHPHDSLTYAYLQNSTKLNDKKADLKLAASTPTPTYKTKNTYD